MAYRAYLNNEIFFATDIDQDELRLLDAPIELEAGASGEFDFKLPPCNTAYGRISKYVDDISVRDGDELIFSGRAYSIEADFRMNHVVKCAGYLTLFNDSVARPFTYTGSLQGLVTKFLESHNQQVGEEKQVSLGRITVIDTNDYVYREYTVHAKTIDRIRDLVASYGGYPIIRKENGKFYFDWIAEFTSESTQEVNFRENLLDVKQIEDGTGIATVLIPLGAEIEDEETGEKSRLTIASVNGGLDYIEDAVAIHEFGRIVTFEIWDDVTTASQLLAKGRSRLAEISKQKLRVTISAADLGNAGYDVDTFKIGTKVNITAQPQGIQGRWFTCLSLKFNLLKPGEKRLTMDTVLAGYVSSSRSAQALYNKLIEKVVSNYVTNTDITNITTQLNTKIEYNTTLIEQNAQQIALKADASVVDSMGTRISAAESELLIQAGQIAAKASTEDLNALGSRVTSAEADIDANAAAILLKADQTVVDGLGTRISSAEADIDANTAAIALKASQADVTALGSRISSAETDIDANAAAIALKASQADLTALGGRVSAAEANIDANAAAILLKADQTTVDSLGTRVTSAEADIDANAAAIALKASQTDVTALGSRVTTVEQGLDAAQGQISQKVSTSDYNGETIASLINQSASTVLIEASHIDMIGTVDISAFSTASKAQILSDAEAKTQFYLSTSTTAAEGGEWSDTVPAWSDGKYIWTRTVTTKTDANGDASVHESAGTYDQNLTRALSTATTAQTNANAALYKSHYATCSTAAAAVDKVAACTGFQLTSGATVTVYFANANTAESPTLNVNGTGAKPIRVKNAVITQPYYWLAKDTVTFTYNGSAWVMAESSAAAVIAAWCHNNDKTQIDGGMLATGTVIADKIRATDLYALGADLAGWKVNSSSLYRSVTDGNTTYTLTLRSYNPSGVTYGAIYTGETVNGKTTYPFRLNYNGAVVMTKATVTGAITATSLTLGSDVTIPYSKLSGAPDLTVYISKDGTIGTTPASGKTGFVVSSAGLLKASNAIIYGTIYATAGTIGGLAIESNSIHTANVEVTSNANNSVALSSSTFTRTIGGTSRSSLKFAIGANFGVNNTGAVYASNITITGGSINVAVSGEETNYINLNYSTVRQSWLGAKWAGFVYAYSPSLYYKSWLSAESILMTSGSINHTASSNWTTQMQINGEMIWGRKVASSTTYSWWLDFKSDGYSECVADYLYYKKGQGSYSDRRVKRDIEALDVLKSVEFVNGLLPVSFRYLDEDDIHHGFLAQDVKAIAGSWAVVGKLEREDVLTLSYTEIIADMVVGMQMLFREVSELKAQLMQLQA